MRRPKLSAIFRGPGLLIVLLFITVLDTPADACDYCLLTQGLSPLETTQGYGFRVDGRYTLLNSMFTGTNEVENHDGEQEKHFTTQISGFYNLSSRVTLIAVVPFANRRVSLQIDDHHDEGEGHGEEEGHPAGEGVLHSHGAPGSAFSIGDVNLLGRYTFFRHHNVQQSTLLAVQAGIKIPTGQTDARDDAGEFLDAHIQPGTGSWNFLVGLSFNYVKNKFGLSSNALYSVNTTGEAGDDDYRFGNWLNADITAKYPLLSRKPYLFLSFGVNGEFRGKEEINGTPLVNTGGEVLYATPGIQLMFSRHVTLEAAVLYPFYHNLDGPEQLGEDFKTFIGINYLVN